MLRNNMFPPFFSHHPLPPHPPSQQSALNEFIHAPCAPLFAGEEAVSGGEVDENGDAAATATAAAAAAEPAAVRLPRQDSQARDVARKGARAGAPEGVWQGRQRGRTQERSAGCGVRACGPGERVCVRCKVTCCFKSVTVRSLPETPA